MSRHGRWPSLLALLLLVGCGGVLEIRVEREPPAPDLPLGKVAYVSGGDLWVKDLQTGRQTRLTQDGGNSRPRWSSDGRWLAFLKGDQLWVAEVRSRESLAVGEFAVSELAWSSTAAQLAYLSASAGLGIWEAGTDATRTLAAGSAVLPSGYIGWDPQGRWITHDDRGIVEWSLRSLTPDGAATGFQYPVAEADRVPRLAGWSPDGRWLAAWLGPASPEAELDGLPLCLFPAEGGEPLCLQDKVLLHPEALAWSAQGRLAIVLGGGRETWLGKGLSAVDPNTLAVQSLVEAGQQAPLQPVWSPDGERIAYSAGPPTPLGAAYARRDVALAARRIWLVEPGSGQRQQLTRDSHYRDERPLWSADGQYLLFARIGAEGASLWLLRADGSDARQVVSGLSPGPDPVASYGRVDWSNWWDWWRPAGPVSKR